MRLTPPKRLLAAALTLAIAGTVYSQTPVEQLLEQAEQGSTQARLELAKHYSAHEQRALAREQLEKAAAAGSSEAHRLLALDLSKDENQDAWKSAIGHATVAGDAKTNVILGVRAAGRALDKSLDESVRDAYAVDAQRLLTDASTAGDADATWHLGYLHVTGQLKPYNREGGMQMIRAAAEHGHPVAARYLAHAFQDVAKSGKARVGMGLESSADIKTAAAAQAVRFLEIAASAGNALAAAEVKQGQTGEGASQRAMLERLADEVVQQASADDATLSLSTPRMTALVGKPHATYASADIGAGAAAAIDPSPTPDPRAEIAQRDARISILESDLRNARLEITDLRQQLAQFQHYQAAQLGAESKNDAGLRFYAKGDYEDALAAFRKAAEYDHSGAIGNMALLYLNGQAVQQDVGQAVKLLERSSELGNLVATENLAEMYERGTGVGYNPARAILWYRRAESMGSVKAGAALRRLGAGPVP